jgi:hypothetical protein
VAGVAAKGQTRTAARLFDHLVGTREQRGRNLNANRLGGLEVDDQLDFVGAWTGRSADFSHSAVLSFRPVVHNSHWGTDETQ